MYKDARNRAGLSREEAAYRIHTSPRALANYELGQATPPPDIVLCMSREYNAAELPERYCSEHCAIGQTLGYIMLDGVSRDLASVLLSLQQETKEAVDKLESLLRLARNKRSRRDFTDEEWAAFTPAFQEWLDVEHNIRIFKFALGSLDDLSEQVREHNAKCQARGYSKRKEQAGRREAA